MANRVAKFEKQNVIPEDFPDNVQTFILQPYGIICEDTSIPLVPGERNAPEFNVCVIGDS